MVFQGPAEVLSSPPRSIRYCMRSSLTGDGLHSQVRPHHDADRTALIGNAGPEKSPGGIAQRELVAREIVRLHGWRSGQKIPGNAHAHDGCLKADRHRRIRIILITV